MLRPAACLVAATLVLSSRPARAQRPGPHLVTVHLDAPRGTELRGRPTVRDAWWTVCTAPCDAPLDRTWLYEIDGSGSVALGSARDGDAVHVVVTPPPSRTPARALIAGGIVVFIAGEAMSVAAFVSYVVHLTHLGQPLKPWVGPVAVGGTAVEIAGALVLVAGAIYDSATRNTRHVDVTWHPPPVPPAAPAEGEVGRGARATAMWAPGFVGVPLVGGTL